MDLDPSVPDELRVPVVEEQVSVGRRQVETDRVRVRTVVEVREAGVEALLQVGRLDVIRVPVDREVTEAPAPRRVGDTLIIPIVEERLVVEKRLYVVEEVHVTSSSAVEAVTVPVTLRQTRAVVERDYSDPSAAGNNP